MFSIFFIISSLSQSAQQLVFFIICRYTTSAGMPKLIGSLCSMLLITVLIFNVSCIASRRQNYNFSEENLIGNILVTSKYALFAQNKQLQPTLKKLSFETMKLETITYEKTENWTESYQVNLVDFKNGDIAYGQNYHVFILNNQTLELKQKIGSGYTIIQQVTNIMAYIDQKTNESIYFVGRQNYGTLYSELKKEGNGKYVPEFRFATQRTQTYPMYMTGISSAVSLNRCDLSYWTNFNSVLDRSRDMKYFMSSKYQITVSYDETFFVVRNDTGFYEFYTLDEKYDVKFRSAIFVNYNDHRKGIFSDDDKFLFVSLSNSRDKHDIAKIDVLQEVFTLVTDTDGSSDNQVDFALFASKFNRFVTIAVRNKNYYLQLRTVDSLQILHEILLQFDFPIIDYKLIGGPFWGLSFVVAVRTKPYGIELEKDSKMFLFSAEGDKIAKINVEPPETSFATLTSSYQYIVSYKPRFPTIKLFHFSNISLTHEFFVGDTYDAGLSVQKSIVKIGNSIYNLEQSFQSRGWFYWDPEPQWGNMLSIIFQNRGIIYNAPTWTIFQSTVTKVIYNISVLPVTSSIFIGQSDQSWCDKSIYYVSSKTGEDLCNLVFYIENNGGVKLIRYNECTKVKTSFPINEYPDNGIGQLFLSSDNKYVIAIANHWSNDKHLIDIHPIASLQKIAYHSVVEYHRDQQKMPLFGFDIDFVNGSMVLLKTPNLIWVDYTDGQSRGIQEETNLIHQSI